MPQGLSGLFVLDASAAFSWHFPDQQTQVSHRALAMLEDGSAITPALWAFEIASAMRVAERTGRMDAVARDTYLEFLWKLPIAVEHRPAHWLLLQILPLARKYNLSAYDAAYLELAIRESIPLATLDDALAAAARLAGVVLIE